MTMTYSGSALVSYLYGLDVDRAQEGEDSLVVIDEIAYHRWGSKKVKSGFFMLPNAEHISAVFFNSSGTLSKFNRMGVKVGLGSDSVRLTHSGVNVIVEHDSSTPQMFSEEVVEGYSEMWIDGMDVYHNPNSLHPLNPDLLPGAAHHMLTHDGRLVVPIHTTKLITSRTSVTVIRPNP